MSNGMMDVSQTFADAVADVASSVVRVAARRRVAASGILWDQQHVVTAHHVLETEEGVTVGMPDGAAVSAEIVGRDPTTDLAMLRLEEPGKADPAAWRDAAELRVGELVLAVARPHGSVQASLGMVSALEADRRTRAGGRLSHLLAVDLVMYPGFSGGALIDGVGKVVGLTSSALMRGRNLALPLATVRRVADELREHGAVRRGFLGVGVQVVKLPEPLQEVLGRRTGLMVVSVEPEGPAGQAGLALGDVLLALDGDPTGDVDDLMAALGADRVGRAVSADLLRGGERASRQVTLGARR